MLATVSYVYWAINKCLWTDPSPGATLSLPKLEVVPTKAS